MPQNANYLYSYNHFFIICECVLCFVGKFFGCAMCMYVFGSSCVSLAVVRLCFDLWMSWLRECTDVFRLCRRCVHRCSLGWVVVRVCFRLCQYVMVVQVHFGQCGFVFLAVWDCMWVVGVQMCFWLYVSSGEFVAF